MSTTHHLVRLRGLGRWPAYTRTVASAISQIVFATYLAWINLSNPVPDPAELLERSVTVLWVREHNPHLHVRVEDGEETDMEFPTVLVPTSRAYHGLKRLEKERLPQCRGWVKGVPLHNVMGNRFRVWSIDCGDVRLTFDESRTLFDRLMRTNKVAYGLYWLAIVLLTCIVFFSDRRNLKGAGV